MDSKQGEYIMVKSSDSCTTILVDAPKYCNFTI